MTKPAPKPLLTSTLWEDIQADFAAKAGKDADFRRELLADPAAVLGKELARIGKEKGKLPEDLEKVELPNDMKVVVLEQQTDALYLIIPPLVAQESNEELSMEQLDAVAGGSDDFCNGTACTLTIPGSADCFTY